MLFSQITKSSDISQTLRAIDTYGLSLVILIFIALVSFYVVKRLFHKDDGILTNVTKKHIDFLERIAAATEKNALTSETNARTIEQIEKTNAKIESAFTHLSKLYEDIQISLDEKAIGHKKTHQSIKHLCRAFMRIVSVKAPDLEDDIKPHMDAIKDILHSKTDDD